MTVGTQEQKCKPPNTVISQLSPRLNGEPSMNLPCISGNSAIVTDLEQEFLSFAFRTVRCIVTTRGSSHGLYILQVC